MDTRRKSLIITAVLTFFYGLYYWGIPALINIEKRIDYIEQKVFEQTGYKVSVKDPYIKMGHTPSIWFMAENIALLNDNGSKALNMEHSAVKIHFLPLLFGKIQIGNLSCDSIDVNLIYTANSELKLGQYKLEKLPKSKMELNKAYFRIGNYKFRLDDLEQNKQILLDGSYLTLDEFKKNKRIKLSTFANLYVNQKSSDIMADIDIKLPINRITEDQFKVKGRITNLNLADFSDYAKALPGSKITALTGYVNMITDTSSKNDNHKNIFTKLSIDNLGIMHETPEHSIYCSDNLDIRMDIDTIRNGLNIQNMKIESKGINMLINGKITRPDAKIPDIDMNVSINDSRVESFIPLMPGEKDLLEEIDFIALKRNPFYGNISGSFKLKGKADKPDAAGKILITNGYLIAPLPQNTPKAIIKLTLAGDKMVIDAIVPASKQAKVLVTGDADLFDDKSVDLIIKSTSDVDLKTAQTILNPLHEILKFDIGPVPIMDIHGIGNVDLHVIGTRKNPRGWGVFNFKNTTAQFLEIHNLIMKNGAGTLTFDDRNTQFLTTSATLNNKPVSVSGTCTVQGVLDFDITAKQQDLGDILKIIKTSPMLKDLERLLSPISSAKGVSDLILKLTGTINDINNITFNKNVFAKGSVDLFSNSVTLQGIPVNNISGRINFENLDADFVLNSNLEESQVRLNGKLNEKTANVNVVSDKFVLKDGLSTLNIPYKDDIGNIHTSFIASYNGRTDKLDIANLNVKGKIYASKGKNISIENAAFNINNSNLKTTTLKGYYKSSPFLININASKILSPKQSLNGNFNIKGLNLSNLKDFKVYLPEINGVIDINGYVKDNAIYADTSLNNINFIYSNVKTIIQSGKIQLKKDALMLNKITAMFGEMPVSIDGKIYNIDKKVPDVNLYLNAKPTQEFIDQFFNNRTVYPIKIKGDLTCSTSLSGSINAIHNKSELKMSENASIYYMGATLGSVTEPVTITIDDIIYPNGVKINNFQYDKLLRQNNKTYVSTQLNASGNIGFLKDNDLSFSNFKIKTKQPTDAKIFNIIFRKPLMKQGMFTSDITINGKASAPVILGALNISSIDMPFFDATIKDIDVDFKKDKIYLKSKGIILTNDLNIAAVIKNSPNLPVVFEDIKLNLEDLDLNRISSALRDYETDKSRNLASSAASSILDISSIIIQKAEIFARNIKIKNLTANDLSSHLTLNNKMLLDIENFKFDLAEGTVNGNVKYDIGNNNFNLKMDVKDTNAQILAEMLFDLKGQIYGSVTGSVNLHCNGKSQDTCTQTLGGNVNFDVSNGRMPKLGSLEYLLKAGNLIKSGITGLSINGIIDLITPYKTGEFDSINGSFSISDGITDDIEIYSAGRDLNIYIKGKYNFTNLLADMQVFGALTKNFTTLFGKITNASLNTLFNTIPGINVSEAPSVITDDIKKIPNSSQNTARTFTVEIYGDINGEDYVKSFKWVK